MSRPRQPRRARSQPALALRQVQLASADAQQELAHRLGVGVTDVAALQHLGAADPPIGPVELGHRLGIRSASATTLVDRLEQSGHVTRTADPRDRRRKSLVLSAESIASTLQALGPLLADIDSAAARLTEAEAEAVTRFLLEAAAAMRRFAHGPNK